MNIYKILYNMNTQILIQMSVCKISNKLAKICEKAREAMINSNMPMRLGACVIHKGKVCATGFNHTHRSCISGYNFPAIHAEMNAVSSFLKKTNGRVLYDSPTKCVLPKRFEKGKDRYQSS